MWFSPTPFPGAVLSLLMLKWDRCGKTRSALTSSEPALLLRRFVEMQLMASTCAVERCDTAARRLRYVGGKISEPKL